MRNLLLTCLLGSVAILTTACTTEPHSGSSLTRGSTTGSQMVVMSEESASSPMSVGAGDSLGQAIFSKQLAIARAKRHQQQEEVAGASTDFPLSE